MRATEQGRRGVVAAILIVAVTWAVTRAPRVEAADLPEEAAQRAVKELNYAEARALLGV